MSESRAEAPAVETELREFLETLRDSETCQRFVEAQKELEADSEAVELLETHRQKQDALQDDEFDPSVMGELRDLQTELSNNETIQQHRDAQAELVDLLQRTNDAISERIDQEFARSLGGGCC